MGTLTNPAVVDDLAARWRPLSPAEREVAAALLGDAWVILLARVPNLETRLAAVPSALSADLVVAVECAMVLRVLRNPDGKRQESIDDYSWTRDNAVSAGLLYVGEDELQLLMPNGSTGDAFTIAPSGIPGYSATRPINWFELNL